MSVFSCRVFKFSTAKAHHRLIREFLSLSRVGGANRAVGALKLVFVEKSVRQTAELVLLHVIKNKSNSDCINYTIEPSLNVDLWPGLAGRRLHLNQARSG